MRNRIVTAGLIAAVAAMAYGCGGTETTPSGGSGGTATTSTATTGPVTAVLRAASGRPAPAGVRAGCRRAGDPGLAVVQPAHLGPGAEHQGLQHQAPGQVVVAAGERRVVPVVGGSFSGSRLRGVVLPGDADWVVMRPDGVLVLDVRITLRTDDGALIAMTYRGLRHGPDCGGSLCSC